MDSVRHSDVGAYVLGVLDDDEQRAFVAHLAGCEQCRSEADDLSNVSTALGRHRQDLASELEPPASPASPPVPTPEIQPSVKPSSRRSWYKLPRNTFALAAASTLIAAMGGLGIGATVVSSDDTPEQSDSVALFEEGMTISASDADTGAEGTVAVAAESWGTDVALRLSGVSGPLECELIAITKDGDEEVASSWTIPAGGYGDGSTEEFTFRGGVASSPDEIDSFVVRTTDDETLLTVEA